MSELLQKLIQNDIKLAEFTDENAIIQHGLAPLIIQTSQTQQSLNLTKARLLEQAKFQNWKQKAEILFSELNKNAIDFLVFKGFAFTYLLYQNSPLRPHSDIDIIIEKKDYDKVRHILVELGYQQFPSRQGQFVSFQNSFYDNKTPQAVIDLHWQINNRIEFHQYFTFQDLYRNSIDLKTDTFSFKTLGLIDAFILGCFHYQAHRPEDRKHIWLYDLALLWSELSDSEQFACFDKAKSTQQTTIVMETLKQLKQTYNDCLVIKLSLIAETNEATSHYLKPRKNKFSDIISCLKNIKGISNKLKFISEYVFQSRAYVKNRYHLSSNSWVYLYYPRMWIEDIVKLFKNP
jgi:hypothetical protein